MYNAFNKHRVSNTSCRGFRYTNITTPSNLVFFPCLYYISSTVCVNRVTSTCCDSAPLTKEAEMRRGGEHCPKKNVFKVVCVCVCVWGGGGGGGQNRFLCLLKLD